MEERYIILSYTISDIDSGTCPIMVKGEASWAQIREIIRKHAKDNYPEYNGGLPQISAIEIIDRASAEVLYPDYFSPEERR